MGAARDAFVEALAQSGLAHRLLTPEQSLPNTAMIAFSRVDGRNLLPAIDLVGVFASHGSACSSGSPQPPAVLRAMGLSEEDARACVRFSCGADLGTLAARDAALLVARAAGQRIDVLVRAGTSVPADGRVRLIAQADRVHLFDRPSGRSLGVLAPSAGGPARPKSIELSRP